MQFLTRTISLLTLIFAAAPLLADYTIQQQGVYTGTVTGKDYVTGKAEVFKETATLVINASSWSISFPATDFIGIPSQFIIKNNTGAVLHDSNGGFHLHGSLHIKSGKGGTTIKGPVLLQITYNGDLVQDVEAKLSLKKEAP
jgi:hypothetical protein